MVQQTVSTPRKMTQEFIRTRHHVKVESERDWIRSFFSCLQKVAKSKPSFIIDDVWSEIDLLQSRGRLPKTKLDQRIIGVMLRFAVAEGVISSSGYYAKSDRPGSRPVMVWNSALYSPRRAAA